MSTTAAAIAKHIVHSIETATPFESPAPYIVMNNVFPTDFYNSVMSAYDSSSELFKPWHHKGDKSIFFGSYTDRSEFRIPDDFDGKSGEAENTWLMLKSALEHPTVFEALKAQFSTGFSERFGQSSGADSAIASLRSTLLITKHQAGYYLGPHTDRFEKIFTCVFNFAENDKSSDLGTAMYLPKKEGMTCKGLVHHNPADFNLLTITPFLPNTATVFFRDDRLFHGVEKISLDRKYSSERRNVQFNYWE